ncbi:uncharacterized protein Dana_GF15412, isoform B [Drosophila ananassae]|uniref:Uncharacterized protein, isoform B n=1 Tax=Drosophila ananassae TaxID=7217 RepID=A0A0N8NZ66_DROAN|nr:uncharacterized protein LOC6498221 isoform X2 [Drosophila ananassae]KPU73468.1 uncharacterized protein Dana_GF15412, isoform B [Drosophila ananassae]
MSIARSIRSSRRTQVLQGTPDIGHFIYCVNFYDNGLKAVQEEFVKRVISGTRRAVFVIDLKKEILASTQHNERFSRSRKTLGSMKPVDPISITLAGIESCLEEYERVTKTIDAEANFDLYNYWQKNIPAQLKNLTSNRAKGKPGETKRGSNTAKPKTAKGSEKLRLEKLHCTSVNAKEHHKVGKGAKVLHHEYIKDNPVYTKMLILIIGQMDNDFYRTLLSYEQPLRAIIHFLPEDSAYDMLVPRPRRERELQAAVATIQRDIHSLRKRTPVKPVGIFQQKLPQMSACMATKFSNDIFDQLSWYMYDVETLRDWYRRYYVECYQETDVKMDPSLQLQDAFHVVESLSIQGHYLKAQMPAARDDDGTVYLYVESLMSTFGNPRELMTETEVLLLANPTPAVQTRVLDKVKVYANAFKSIVKLPKNDRIFLEESNDLLTSLLSYMDQGLMRNIYHGCLEYNLMRRYFTSGYITNAINVQPYNGDPEPIYLPKYAQLYLTDDSVTQRLIHLVNDYDEFTVEEVRPNVQLYTFRRGLNEVFEQEKQTVIPTRLCFRDFTLYEMEQFLEDFVTPQKFSEMQESLTSANMSQATVLNSGEPIFVKCSEGPDRVTIDPNIFVRPKSIKGKQKKAKEPVDSSREFDSVAGNRKHSTTASMARGDTLGSKAMRPSAFFAEEFRPTNLGDSIYQSAGLGLDHPMLKGYNLDDTRQTIKTKTSRYFFEEGRVTLYEEKWNFRQMNKCLSLEVGDQHVHFRNPSLNVLATDACVRIESKNGISLRAMPKELECAKAVLNYPNGLSTYCHDTHAEHLWQYQENELDESRRICTPYGCVISFYQNTDTVVIMRYNGEVYYLYSLTDAENEEEEELNSEFINACSTQSTYSSYKPIPTDDKSKCHKKKRRESTRVAAGAESIMRPSMQSMISKQSGSNAGARKNRLAKSKQYAALFASVEFELNFLNFIMALYKLSYRHLKLITTLGSVVHVQRDGKIWCGKPYRNTEWHDYYVNEAYSMRDDGVKMIWTVGELRCYHSDGTCIKSGTVEGWDPGTERDDIDMEITSSSSHRHSSVEEEQRGTIYINAPDGLPFDQSFVDSQTIETVSQTAPDKVRSISECPIEEEEGEVVFDMSYITYMPNTFAMFHKIYSSIQFNFNHITKVDLNIETSVSTCDNMKLRIFKSSLLTEIPISISDSEFRNYTDIPPDMPSSSADSDEWTRKKRFLSEPDAPSSESPIGSEEQLLDVPDILDRTCVEIECNNLLVHVFEDRTTIQTQLRKFGCDENAKCDLMVRDNIVLEVNYSESLSTIFRKWIEELTSFINCFCPKWRTLYFLESLDSQCQKKGFELMKAVPPLGKYNFCAGNYFIDAHELISVDNKMKNNYPWFNEDLVKFPRFPLYKKAPPTEEFPLVLKAKIFVEIPAQLANTDRIYQFVNEFDRIKFRKQRYRFNEAVLFHLHPRLRLLVQQEISKRSWKNHHEEMRRRKFMEQQRLSLYLAMLKHKVYPNYFQFKDQFYSHVRNIDFFNFMTAKCNEKAHPEEVVVDPVEEPTSPTSKASTKYRKKCYCPKYVKSME